MSKTLFEEAIADAKLLREAAEQNAKNAIIEAVTPRIREFIENQLVGGNSSANPGDFLQAALSEGDDDDDEDLALDETALRSLVDLMGGPRKAPSVQNTEKAAIGEAVSMLSAEEQERLLRILQESEKESKHAKVESDGAYEINLDELKASISSEIKTRKAPNGDNKMRHMHDMEEEDLYELDEMMDDEDLDEAILKLIGTAEEREAFDKLGLSGIEFEEEEGKEEIKMGDEEMAAAEPEGEEGGEEPAAMAEAVYEIDENMLRRELARLREAKARKKSKGTNGSHSAAASAFGGGTLEGDVHDVDLNKNDKMKAQVMKEARENRALRQQLNDYRGAVETLREQLSDLNLFNAKLLYVNKILQNKDVAPNQRRAIIEALDGASNLREAKLLYESLSTSISSKNQSLNESVKHTAGLASRPVASSSARMSGAGEVDRWATLAGLK